MKKVLIIFIALAMFQQNADAQIFSWGLRLGGASTNIDATPQTIYENNANMDSLQLSVTNANYGIHAGLYTRIKLGPVYVQPEVLFNTQGYEYTLEDLSQSGASQVFNDKFNTLNIPIMVGFKTGPIRLQAGPVGTLLLSNDNQLETLTETYDRKLSNLSWGYQAGAGVDIGKLNLDVKYEGGLGLLSGTYEIYGNDYEFDSRQNRWVLTLGWRF